MADPVCRSAVLACYSHAFLRWRRPFKDEDAQQDLLTHNQGTNIIVGLFFVCGSRTNCSAHLREQGNAGSKCKSEGQLLLVWLVQSGEMKRAASV